MRAGQCTRGAWLPLPLPADLPTNLPMGGQVCESRWGGTPGASFSAQTWGACRTPDALAGTLGGAAGPGRPGVRPAGGRLHLLSESLSHVCRRCSCRGGGGAGLGAIIWEDAVPCPAGTVVSPLKQPAPHCSWAEAALPCFAQGGRRKGRRRRPTPESSRGPTSCSAAASACSWRIGIPAGAAKGCGLSPRDPG